MENKRNAVNIYSIIDNELARLHDYCNRTLQYEDRRYHEAGHPNGFQRFSPVEQEVSAQRMRVSKRIFEIQEILLKAIATHDEVVQEKVAELALTSLDSESK